MKAFNSEMIEKAKGAKSAEELLALAKENNVELGAEEAVAYFAQMNPKCGELSDEELDNVAGGACSQESSAPTCPKCGTALRSVRFNDGIDPQDRNYQLCYGCGTYGLWYGGYGWTTLPEERAKYIVEETR